MMFLLIGQSMFIIVGMAQGPQQMYSVGEAPHVSIVLYKQSKSW